MTSEEPAYLVAGCAGFIGRSLCLRLLRDGYPVVGIDNLSTGQRTNVDALTAFPGFTFIEADVCEPLSVPHAVRWVQHLASPASPVDYMRLPLETLNANSRGTWNLLLLAEATGAGFTFASSSEVYGSTDVAPQPETYPGRVDPTGPRSMYAEAKRFGEALVTAFAGERGVRVRIARMFNVYGPGMRAHDGRVIPEFIDQAIRDVPITVHGDGQQVRCFTYVDDVIDGLIQLERWNAGPVNLGDPSGLVPIQALAEMIRSAATSKSPIVHTTRRPDDPTNRIPDITRARGLGWHPTTLLADGIAGCVAQRRSELGTVGPDDDRLT